MNLSSRPPTHPPADFPHSLENCSGILPLTHDFAFSATDWQQHNPPFPKHRESDGITAPRLCSPSMDTIFHWHPGACSNPAERDGTAEQNKFLSFPPLSINTLGNTLEWEKNVPLSQSRSALNAQCSAGHLLTLAASQDSCFSKRAISL